METKELIEKSVNDGFKDLEGKVDEKLKGFVDKQKESIAGIIEEKGYTTKEEVETAVKAAKDELESVMLQIKKSAIKTGNGRAKSFKEFLGDAFQENKETLVNLASKKNVDGKILLKADEDMNDSNFGTGALDFATEDKRPGVYEQPFGPLWLRTILPNTTTTGSTIKYLRENGGIGAAGVWDGTGDIETLAAKPGTSSLFELVTEDVLWIAGITRVKREMLDDIAWLMGYLSRQLTVGRRGLWVAENTQIYTSLTTNSVAYDGTKTIPIEMIVDAAFGQLKDNYYNATTILMNHRDVVNLIVLNKAITSGEYDLPPGIVAVVNGQLTVGGVPVIGVPNIDAGTFMVFDRNATEFVSRMSPEVRFFEQDRDNVPKNLVTVRAEERIATLVYDENAIITGTFTPTT